MADHTSLDQVDDFVIAQSQTPCHQIIKAIAEAMWRVQCLKQRNLFDSGVFKYPPAWNNIIEIHFFYILYYNIKFMTNSNAAVPCLKHLVGEISPRENWFDSRLVRVGFVVNRLAVGQIRPRIFLLSPVSIIPPLLTTHSFTFLQRYIPLTI